MLCPYNYLYDGEHFSEWRKECQECWRFNECLMKEDMMEMGDNYPTYDHIHKVLKASNDRKEMIQKLLQANEPPINENDLSEFRIDMGLYNARIKRQRKDNENKQ